MNITSGNFEKKANANMRFAGVFCKLDQSKETEKIKNKQQNSEENTE